MVSSLLVLKHPLEEPQVSYIILVFVAFVNILPMSVVHAGASSYI